MKRIICHGDSLTEGSDIETAFRWPSLLQNRLVVEVINTGISGDTTGGLLSRFPSDVVAYKPDVVILMGGTNDFWWDLPLNMVVANLYAMARQAHYQGIAPIFGLPLPFDADLAAKQPYDPPEAGYDQLHTQLHALILKLPAAAAEKEIPVLDFHRLFIDDDDNIKTHWFLEDGVHPNREGHRRMAEMTATKLKEWFLF